MKKLLGSVLLLVVLAVVMGFSPGARAQGVPPVIATNVVRLTPNHGLFWDASTDAVGYWATMRQGTNVWRGFTTNSFVRLSTLNTNVTSGNYQFEVVGVDQFGSEGGVGVLATNISRLPSIIVNLRIEILP